VTERVDLQEFIGGFVAEAEELVAVANASLLEIDAANATGGIRPKALKDLFRALHTIKGLAGMVGVEPIVEIAHALENLVRIAEQSGGRLRRGAVEVALTAIRAIGERVHAVADKRPVAPVPDELLDSIAAIEIGAETAGDAPAISELWDERLVGSERHHLAAALGRGAHAYTLTFASSSDKAARGVTIASVRARLGELGEVLKVVPRSVGRAVAFDLLVLTEASVQELGALVENADVAPVIRPEPIATDVSDATDAAIAADAITPFGRALVRVELSRLDELQDQLSQLIVSRFRLEREIAALRASGVDVRRLLEVADAQARQLRDLRRGILRARLIRVAEVIEPLSLLVRSLARSGQREVRLELDTRDAELDKAVADRLLPAIVHLVRNAIDHAIEPPEERLAAGKPRAGTVRVRCVESSGNQLALVVSDDGRGIDRDVIARRGGGAIDSDVALLGVISAPGFSTLDVATRTSGRGVGMDIVRKIIVDQLGGQLDLETKVGVGTSFTLRVPVTIAIVDVFSFACGSQTFVVPVSAIDEIFELEPSQCGHMGETVSLLERRGRAMPLVSLGAVLAVDAGAGASKALVVRRSSGPIAFAVDRMLGRQEVVVRPIEDALARGPGIAGATDLGDGRPTLVLDLIDLGARMAARERHV
jgi:two-component system, chemotaxis family, sensor kinase CheA